MYFEIPLDNGQSFTFNPVKREARVGELIQILECPSNPDVVGAIVSVKDVWVKDVVLSGELVYPTRPENLNVPTDGWEFNIPLLHYIVLDAVGIENPNELNMSSIAPIVIEGGEARQEPISLEVLAQVPPTEVTKRTKLFADLEFTELSRDGRLISIGIIAEDGQTFYAENALFDPATNLTNKAFLDEHVVPHLMLRNMPIGYEVKGKNARVYATPLLIANALNEWLSQFGDVEFWGDVNQYDWMQICDMYGTPFAFTEANPNAYYIPFDFATRLNEFGIDPDINREAFAMMEVDSDSLSLLGKHNALYDAYVLKRGYERTVQHERQLIPGNRLAELHYLLQNQAARAHEDHYQRALYNGLELAAATIEGRQTELFKQNHVTGVNEDQEILIKLRAEFDYLWQKHDRDNGVSDAYLAELESLVLTRLAEAGLYKNILGTDGVAGLYERGILRQPAEATPKGNENE